ncbi:polyprenyl synthetase family protein [Desulforudis sp. 1088]|uniref:polyprenyl synthetase family protein n=1 Tax=unclassified Candidatus Desulforudis TaxID=2635950 RepID=UPI003CE56A37
MIGWKNIFRHWPGVEYLRPHPFLDEVRSSLASLGISGEIEDCEFLPPFIHPVLVLECAWGAQDKKAVVDMAVTAELIHRVSVWHGNVEEQLGKGTSRTILTGDLALAHAFRLLARHYRYGGLPLMAGAIAAIAEGCVSEQKARFNASESVQNYIARRGKTTAYLMAACCRLGGQLAERSPAVLSGLWKAGYALGLGLASAADVSSWMVENLIKQVHPLLRGFVGLPEIYLLGQGQQEFARMLAKGSLQPRDLPLISQVLQQTGALDKARRFAAYHLVQGKELLKGFSSPAFQESETPLLKGVNEMICDLR